MYHYIDLMSSLRGSFDPAKGNRHMVRFQNQDSLAQWLLTERQNSEEIRTHYQEGASAIREWLIEIWLKGDNEQGWFSDIGGRFWMGFSPEKHWAAYKKGNPRIEKNVGRWFKQGLAYISTKWRKHIQMKFMGLWSPTQYKEGTTARRNDDVKHLNCVVLDMDDGKHTLEACINWWAAEGTTVWGHESFGSTPEHPKFRLIFPLDTPIPAGMYPELWKNIAKRSLGTPDPACKDLSRLYYANYGTHQGPGKVFDIWGMPIDWRKIDLSPPPPTFKQIHPPVHRKPLFEDERDFTVESERLKLAHELGARLRGNKASGIKCPNCSRNEVWFFIAPGQKLSASCNHQGESCGWNGGLWRLA